MLFTRRLCYCGRSEVAGPKSRSESIMAWVVESRVIVARVFGIIMKNRPDNELRFTGSDLVHFVCQQCGEQEVCPSTLMDEYDDESDESPPDVGSDQPS